MPVSKNTEGYPKHEPNPLAHTLPKATHQYPNKQTNGAGVGFYSFVIISIKKNHERKIKF